MSDGFCFLWTYKPQEQKVINYKGDSYKFSAGGYSTSPISDPRVNSFENWDAWLNGGYKEQNFDQAFYSTYAVNVMDAGDFVELTASDIATGKAWAKSNPNASEESVSNSKGNKQATEVTVIKTQAAAANNGKAIASESSTPLDITSNSITKSVPKLNKNNDDAVGNFVLYKGEEHEVILKIGKADADDVMADGTIRRVHTSARLARKAGYPDAKGTVIKELGTTTTGAAKKEEAAEARQQSAKGNSLPLNKEKDKKYKN